MAKLKTDPIDAAAIDRYLATDDDFAFELSTVKLLSVLGGYSYEHGGSYSDPVTGINRQFDIRATHTRNGHGIALAIECKNLRPNFPLLISRIYRQPGEDFHQVIEGPQDVAQSFFRGTSRLGANSIHQLTVAVGKATTQVGVHAQTAEWISDDSEAHEKWAQAIASAFGLIESSIDLLRAHPQHLKSWMVVPVLVVPNDRLWSCDYNFEGNRGGVIPTDHVEFFLNHTHKKQGLFEYTISHLHFVTQSGLVAWLNRIKTDVFYSDKIFSPAK